MWPISIVWYFARSTQQFPNHWRVPSLEYELTVSDTERYWCLRWNRLKKGFWHVRLLTQQRNAAETDRQQLVVAAETKDWTISAEASQKYRRIIQWWTCSFFCKHRNVKTKKLIRHCDNWKIRIWYVSFSGIRHYLWHQESPWSTGKNLCRGKQSFTSMFVIFIFSFSNNDNNVK